jgi:hypothetical protein
MRHEARGIVAEPPKRRSAKRKAVKVMERIARRERDRREREAARPKEFCFAKFN